MNPNKRKKTIRALLVLSSLLMISVLFLPIWMIQLDAPQYPEGLTLKIHANDIKGDVDIINGLNHYIGMKTLHKQDFLEFTVLPYFIIGFSLLFFLAAILYRRWLFFMSFIIFILFGILSIFDFWRWEYNYGHDLDPNAAIQVPGMSYQPPLIGFKQLLNFGAYSIPDIGGWILLFVGVLLLLIVFFEVKGIVKSRKIEISILVLFLFATQSCNDKLEKIVIGKDSCQFCKMGFVDEKFGAILMNSKGKSYKFDDIGCLLEFVKSGKVEKKDIDKIFLTDFSGDHDLFPAENIFLLESPTLHSPMKSNIAAFSQLDSLKLIASSNQGVIKRWTDMFK